MTVFPKLIIVETDATLTQSEQIMKYAAFLDLAALGSSLVHDEWDGVR
jgi:hypothetical protein